MPEQRLQFGSEGIVARSGQRIALLSAAVTSTNSGDALITKAIERLLAGNEMEIFPLLARLTDQQIEKINNCDIAIVCGTNLYQHVFACALAADIISRIEIPMLPLGVGCSAPIGQMPKMDAEGERSVRLLHERCTVASVRDPLSLEYIQSLGIRNVELTGCPVLFYGLKEPDFSDSSNGQLVMSLRTRLLHIEPEWLEREKEILDELCREFQPALVMQSPFDMPIARELADKHGVEILWNENLSCDPMLEGAARAGRSAGFRLHFAMLCLALGKPATLIGSDTRSSEFCAMMGLPFHDVRTCQDRDIVAELAAPSRMDGFTRNWRALRQAMADLLNRNGIENVLGDGRASLSYAGSLETIPG
jgi:polysaccharide pyruvyl transferase WcaK-like protein